MAPPPPVDSATGKPAPARRGKPKGTNPEHAGALIGAAFGAFALLTGHYVEPLTPAEKAEIGADVADAFDTLPFSVGERIAQVGPWAKLGNSLGGAVWKRVQSAQMAQAARKVTPTPMRSPAPNGAPQGPPKAPEPRAQFDVPRPGDLIVRAPAPGLNGSLPPEPQAAPRFEVPGL